MKQLEVQIMGQSYLLGCPEGGEQRLLEAIEKVDTAMCRIRDAGKIKARERIAVLAALNLAFELREPAAAPAAHAVPPQTGLSPPAAPPVPDADSSSAPLSEARLGQVLERLKRALGDDGHLI